MEKIKISGDWLWSAMTIWWKKICEKYLTVFPKLSIKSWPEKNADYL
jgi:hypothetical protein